MEVATPGAFCLGGYCRQSGLAGYLVPCVYTTLSLFHHNMSHSFTQRHLPLITTRIEFRPEQLPSHPSVTTHQEFTPEQTFDLISSEALDDFEAHFNKASTPFEDDNTSDMHDEAVDDSPMDLDDNGRSMTSESEDEEDRNMIEKPKGEVSRQYKLADELQKSGWTLEQIDKLRVSDSCLRVNVTADTSWTELHTQEGRHSP